MPVCCKKNEVNLHVITWESVCNMLTVKQKKKEKIEENRIT